MHKWTRKIVDFWFREKPNFYIEKPLHGEKVTVWAAMSVKGINGPFFFEDKPGDVNAINSKGYLNILKSKSIPVLCRKGMHVDISNVW